MEHVKGPPTGEPFYRMVARGQEVELAGPYECSRCRAQTMIDASWLSIREGVFCPICGVPIRKFSDSTATNINGYKLRKATEGDTVLKDFIEGKTNGIQVEDEGKEAGLADGLEDGEEDFSS